MRSWLVGVALLSSLGVARAENAADARGCLSPGDTREVVSANQVVAPVSAIRAARQAVPKADVVRAELCHHHEALVYVIKALRKDGRFVQVTVDAASGKVAGVQ
jgi:uncharacterized membrane protein YkoI